MSLILGIETSCDETAASVVQDGRYVHSNIIASQHDLHERYQGVVPEIASRAHLQRILPVVQEAIQEANVAFSDLDAIAVGNRPGLIGSLMVGLSAAKALAWSTGKPLIGIDHVRAHLYAANLTEAPRNDRDGHSSEPHPPAPPEPTYPALGLVVSGGHSTIYTVASPMELEPLGQTIDDAVGEAYDKAAVILQLGYPGGPRIDKLAQQGDPTAYRLPRSLLGEDSLDFSFSGLKTALLYAVRGHPQGRGPDAVFPRSADDLTDTQRADLAASFQAAAIDTLMIKLSRAVEAMRRQSRSPHSLIIGGGVSANSLLRRRVTEFGERMGLSVHIPAMAYCLDNAAMIAGLAHHYFIMGRFDDLTLPAIATTGRVTRSPRRSITEHN